MSKGLLKLSNAANTIEARKDFAKLITMAKEQGKSHLAIKHMYPEGAGWRTIDKHIAKLRAALSEDTNKMREDYTGDYTCQVSEDVPCRRVATQVFRECFTPARVAVPACDEHAEFLRLSGYHFDERGTVELNRDIEREEESFR